MEIIYVDDTFFWSVDENNIHDLAMNLRSQGVDLEQEDDAAGFLGVTLVRDEATGIIEMKQVGLIDRIMRHSDWTMEWQRINTRIMNHHRW